MLCTLKRSPSWRSNWHSRILYALWVPDIRVYKVDTSWKLDLSRSVISNCVAIVPETRYEMNVPDSSAKVSLLPASMS